MEKITSLLKEHGYRQSTFDHKNDVWTYKTVKFTRKVYVPLAGNSIMFYDCKPNGSPISYIEFHNCYHEAQMDRLSRIL